MSSNVIEFQLSAPGKIILFGEHSVVHKRTAIATSLNKRTTLKFVETKNQSIEIKMPQIGFFQKFSITQIENILNKSIPLMNNVSFSIVEPKRILHDLFLDEISNDISSLGIHPLTVQQTSAFKGILYLLRGMLGSVDLDLKSFNIEMSSQLAIGAGMGSSASFAVCLAAAFLHYIRRSFKVNNSGLVNVSKSHVEPYVMDLEEPLSEFSSQVRILRVLRYLVTTVESIFQIYLII